MVRVDLSNYFSFWVIYKGKKFIWTHSSGNQEVKEHGAGVCLASEGLCAAS